MGDLKSMGDGGEGGAEEEAEREVEVATVITTNSSKEAAHGRTKEEGDTIIEEEGTIMLPLLRETPYSHH